MGAFEIFIIRCVLAGIFAVLISRFFIRNAPLHIVAGLGILMLGLAYLLEYLRNRDKGGKYGT